MDSTAMMTSAAADSDPSLKPGDHLAPGYVVESHLNRGEVLDVYAVRSSSRATSCVAKTLRPRRQHDRDERAQLLREGRMLTSYTHPHLVRGYELIEHAGRPILIMETLTGTTLSRLITEHGVVDTGDVAILGDQLTALLHYLHRLGIAHLDLKPSNIVVDAGIARVIDLNLARTIGTSGTTAGTYEYKAPEQITGDPVREATDIWGLGGILYRSITGHRPFPRDTSNRVVTDRPDLTGLTAGDSRLAPVVTGCFEFNPDNRPTLSELQSVLTATAPNDGPVANAC